MRIRIVCSPGNAAHLVFADFTILQQIRKLRGHGVHANAESGKRFRPQLGYLATGLFIGSIFVGECEWRAVGQVAPAVTVFVDVAKHVEQGLRTRRIVLLIGRMKGRLITNDARRNRALRGDGLTASYDVDLLIEVVAKNQRAPEGDILRSISANDRIFKIERVKDDLGRFFAEYTDAAFLHCSR